MAKRILQGLPRAKGAGRMPPARRAAATPRPRGKKRLRIIKETKQRIRDIIVDWKGEEFSWDLLMAVINNEFKGEWAPQSIAKHADLQRLFQLTKERVRTAAANKAKGKKKRPVDSTAEFFEHQIDLLKRENADLKTRLAETEARMARWRKNASLNRVSVAMLDAELQHNDRGRSD